MSLLRAVYVRKPSERTELLFKHHLLLITGIKVLRSAHQPKKSPLDSCPIQATAETLANTTSKVIYRSEVSIACSLVASTSFKPHPPRGHLTADAGSSRTRFQPTAHRNRSSSRNITRLPRSVCADLSSTLRISPPMRALRMHMEVEPSI